ncbi:unnamed protein product [[Actinomadura] parvosata subsp. kistnae]|nr:unnamed protein product [Actinomadura parvosata subsp. kistnae]
MSGADAGPGRPPCFGAQPSANEVTQVPAVAQTKDVIERYVRRVSAPPGPGRMEP